MTRCWTESPLLGFYLLRRRGGRAGKPVTASRSQWSGGTPPAREWTRTRYRPRPPFEAVTNDGAGDQAERARASPTRTCRAADEHRVRRDGYLLESLVALSPCLRLGKGRAWPTATTAHATHPTTSVTSHPCRVRTTVAVSPPPPSGDRITDADPSSTLRISMIGYARETDMPNMPPRTF